MEYPSWGVVMTADEPESLLLANVAWHLATGAGQVHLYFDNPDDVAIETLAAISKVRVVVCDDAHWQKLNKGTRPALQMRRQSLNANDAQNHAGTDWLVHLDADEFLLQDRQLGQELPFVAELGAELYIPVWERFHDTDPNSIFDGAFRGTTKGRAEFDAQIFGPDAKYLIHGVLAHSAGKCAIPVGQGFMQGIHWAFKGSQKRENRAPRYQSTTTRLLHFDGLTPLHWLIKVMRYASHSQEDLDRLLSKQRHAQIQMIIAQCKGWDAAIAAQKGLRFLPAETVTRLEGFGLLARPDFPIDAAATEILGKSLDLSIASFDAALRERFPDIVEIIENGI